MKSCELCKKKATIYCDSDQASLCWACDEKVHSANFLVARHSRSLLCHVCQSVTSWTATGSKLGPTLSVCQDWLDEAEDQESSEETLDDDDDDDDDDGDVEVEENQVVSWFTTPDSPPPPSPSSSSSSEESTTGQPEVSRKRMRYNFLDHWDNVGSENVRMPPILTEETAEASGRGNDEDAAVVDSSSIKRRRTRSLKARRTETGLIDRVEEST